jgi:electron transfer flavoprotein beta subunit
MNVPLASFASILDFADGKCKVTREIDAGLQEIEVMTPAVFTCDLRLNTPRFAKVKDIIKAKKKQLDTLNLEDLGIDFAPRLKVLSVEAPLTREGGLMVASVDELVDKLKNEAKLL